MPYDVLAAPSAQKELNALSAPIADGIRRVLKALAADPRGKRFDLKPLRAIDAEPPALRLRVGDYRILLRIDHAAGEILVARIGHRKTVYRGLPASFD